MRFSEWKPLYEAILSDFNFSKHEDMKAAHLLDSLLSERKIASLDEVKRKIFGKKVFVVGQSRNIEKEIEAGVLYRGTIISADGATSSLLKAGIQPDIIVTDLDGIVEDQIFANEKGAIVLIHAHGDNMESLRKWVPGFNGKLIGTTQTKPFAKLYNFGGFTDGDRGVCVASHFGAKEIVLVGFDFEDVNLNKKGVREESKLKKLRWARRIINQLGLSE